MVRHSKRSKIKRLKRAIDAKHCKILSKLSKEITRSLQPNATGATCTRNNTGTERRFMCSDGTAEATYGILNGRPALTVRDLRR